MSTALSFGDLTRRHFTSYQVSGLNAFGVTTRARQIETHVRLNVISRDTSTFGIHKTEGSLAAAAPLVRRQAKPF
jgi:hypothetical protein